MAEREDVTENDEKRGKHLPSREDGEDDEPNKHPLVISHFQCRDLKGQWQGPPPPHPDPRVFCNAPK